MARPAPLLLAYDAECPACRRRVDWIQRRDRWGLVVPFPVQNPELVRMAPELAGLPLLERMHGLDTGTRRVLWGASLQGQVFRRLPHLRWLAWAFALPGASGLIPRLCGAPSGRCAGVTLRPGRER